MASKLADQVLPNLRQGKRKSVIEILTQLVVEENTPTNSLGGLARIATSLSEVNLARQFAQKYVQSEPDDVAKHLSYAGILCELGLLEEGLDVIKPLFEKNSSNVGLGHFMGLVNLQLGRFENAEEYFEKVLTTKPNSGHSWLSYSTIKKFAKNDSDSKTLQRIYKTGKFDDPISESAFYYAMGKAAKDASQLDKAVRYFAKGANIMSRLKSYDGENDSKFVGKLIESYTKEKLDSLQNSNSTLAPIFIVGLPRSGTTLLSQIIQNHSNVSHTGELNFFHQGLMECKGSQIENITNRANELSGIENVWAEVNDIYRHLLSERFGEHTRVVDKSLNNSRFLGAISKVFPKASIIWISRDLEDTAWSCFNTFFSQSLDWSWTMENIGNYFKIEERLKEHWQAALGDRILNISYETLISRPEETIERIMSHCGLSLEPQLLDFSDSNNPIQTASVSQARSPIYKTSVGMYKDQRKMLEPFQQSFNR